MIKIISRDIVILVFMGETIINFVNLKSFKIVKSEDLESKIVDMETYLLPSVKENRDFRFNPDNLNYREKYLLKGR